MKGLPKKAQRLLRWFLKEDLAEEVQGDLEEQFYKNVKESSLFRARLNYWYQVLNYLRPFAIRKLRSSYSNINYMDMFRHNFIISLRNFRRHRMTFIINLIGLSSGLVSVLLIYLWVHDELSVDKFHEKDKQLYQVMKNNTSPQGIETGEDTPGMLASVLAEEMPEVENSVSVFPPAEYTLEGILSLEDTRVKASSKFASKNFFNIFSYPLIHGSKDQILADPSSIAISSELAEKLFHTTENVIGKMVEWEGERQSGQFFISGIFKTPPSNASIQFDIVFNYNLLVKKFPNFLLWESSGPSTYIILQKNTDPGTFNDKIRGLVKSKYEASNLTLFIRPYSSRYLYGEYENGKQVGGRIEYVRLFSIIAIFILLIACINFMNLSTAKSTIRFKEIGIKKAIGASRKTLVFQYLIESILMTMLSLLVALLLAVLLLPKFNEITGKQLTMEINPGLILPIIGIILFTGLFSGSYPAFHLS